MERNKGPRKTTVQAATALKPDIKLAAAGDPAAAARLLGDLAGDDRQEQALAASTILKVPEPALWERLLEFACQGTWAGQRLELPPSLTPRVLRPKLEALLLARQDGPSAAGRQRVLVDGLCSQEAGIRRFAVDLLGQWEDHPDPEPLMPLLRDPELSVRLRAARALGRLGDARAVPALIEALGHSDDLIAGEAAEALALTGEAALEPLKGSLRHHDPYVRWHAAKALAQMANPKAIPAFLEALDDQNFGVRWFAAQGLAALGRHALVPLLRALRTKETTPWLAEAATHVLKNIKEVDLVLLLEKLERQLGDPYANVEVPLEAHRVLQKLEEMAL